MADVTCTAADVRPLPGAITVRMEAAAAIDVGAPVYVSANGEVSEADGSGVATAAAIGVLVSVCDGAASSTAAADGDAVDVCIYGPVTGYSTNMAGGTYFYVDDDAGVIADASGTKGCIIGIGLNGTTLLVRPQVIDLS